MPRSNNSKQFQSQNHKYLQARLKAATKDKRVATRKITVGKRVDLQITSECSCAICMDPLCESNISVTPCGHKFCFTCLQEHLLHSKTCPLCRNILRKDLPKKKIDNDHFYNVLLESTREFSRTLEASRDMEVSTDSGSDSMSVTSETDSDAGSSGYQGVFEVTSDGVVRLAELREDETGSQSPMSEFTLNSSSESEMDSSNSDSDEDEEKFPWEDGTVDVLVRNNGINLDAGGVQIVKSAMAHIAMFGSAICEYGPCDHFSFRIIFQGIIIHAGIH